MYNRQESRPSTMRFRTGTDTLCNAAENADKLFQMLTKDPNATVENMKETLRNMNHCLTLKRSVKARLERNDEHIQRQKQVSDLTKLRYRIATIMDHTKDKAHELFQSLDLWHSHLKVVQGHFGSGVASYFFFLRRLFYLNFVAMILLLSFVVMPQIAKTGSSVTVQNTTFTGKELLTGSDYFSNTILYYGFYNNGTVENYSIPQAYFFTNIALIFIFLILLTYSLASSYRMNYVEVSGELKNIFSNKLFSAWDYSIETEDTARLKSRSIFNELLEMLTSERKYEGDKTCSELLHLYFWRVFINIMIVGALCGTGYLTYILLDKKQIITVESSIMKELTLPMVVSVIAFVVPMIFSAVSKWEEYESKQTEIYMNMIRIVLLRIVVLAVVTYFWLYQKDTIADSPLEINNNTKFLSPLVIEEKCWETQLGEEVYRLMLVDLFCILLLSTLGMEVLRHLMHKWCFSFISEPEFDIAQNTLDLIYTQTLTWLGIFYSPLLPVITLIKLVVVFYIKRISVIQTCQPSLKPWRAAHAQTIFLILAFINFLLTVVATGYSIFVIKPSTGCGPFQHMESRYATVLDLLFSIDKFIVPRIFKYLVSPGVVTGIIVILCVAVYYVRATAKAHQEMVNLLREQLIMEGKDKVFLLKLFKVAFQQANTNSMSRKNTFDDNSDDDEQVYDPRGSADIHRHVVINEGYRDNSVQNREFIPPESYDAPVPQIPTGYFIANVQSQEQQPFEQYQHPKPGWGRLRERSPDNRSTSSQEIPMSECRRPSAVPIDGISAENFKGKVYNDLQNSNDSPREQSPQVDGDSRHSTPPEGSPYNRSASGTPSGSLERGRSDQLRAQRRNVPPVLPRPVHQHGFQYLTRDSPSYSPTRQTHHPTPSSRDSPKQRTFPSKQW